MKLFEPVLFRDGHPAPRPVLSGANPGRVVAAHSGHFALHERAPDGGHLLARDLLGVHKLFFTVRNGDVVSSNYLIDLLRAGAPVASVFSVPAGHCLRVHTGERRYELTRWGRLRFGVEIGQPDRESALAGFAASIRAALDRTFRMLAERFAHRPVYVTLSGGLDSTTIAALAREHFTDLHAVTFALRDPREAGPGSDLYYARRAAADLGVAQIEVIGEHDEVVALLDDVLVYGQDYRDFNVYCGLVNAAIAKAIAARHPVGPRPVVLTGDAMNELLADYTPVEYRGREYFGLPNLDRGRLRRFLVGGLDSGDREVGIFAHYGIETVQPYALCAQAYAALPSDLACEASSKSKLAAAVMGTCIPDYVLARPKVRAQVAVEGEPGGTLALLVGRGLDQEHLRSRFAELLGIGTQDVSDLTRAGYYRSSASYPEPPGVPGPVHVPGVLPDLVPGVGTGVQGAAGRLAG